MQSCKLMFDDVQLADITTIEQLDTAIRKVKRNLTPKNPLLMLIHENNNTLMLGLSSSGYYINFIQASNEPPYYSSICNTISNYDEAIVKFQINLKGTVTEIQQKNLISFQQLLLVAKAFLITGNRPDNIIAWEMD